MKIAQNGPQSFLSGSAADSEQNATAMQQMSEMQPDGSKRYYKGTAFLIGQDLLLTAGHNAAYIPDPSDIEAIFASAPCWGRNDCRERRIMAVKTIVHPLFRQKTGETEYNIAIVKLVSKAPEDYRFIPLANHRTGIGVFTIQVFGFGTDREDDDVPLSAFRLRSISLTPINPGYLLGSEQKFWLDQRHGGICGGDSGGPAIVDGPSSAAIGLAIHVKYSDGISHCLTQAAFTDVIFFRDWIIETVAQLQ
ncbi:MAG: trypsin-like serine protease [Proteobacteria bacterium]|nr:trypsin-like serine protease [Pseudomonadota bacterium]